MKMLAALAGALFLLNPVFAFAVEHEEAMRTTTDIIPTTVYQAIVLIISVAFVISFDIKKKDKRLPALVGAAAVALFVTEHMWIESADTAVFVYCAILVAEDLFERGYFKPAINFAGNPFRIGLFTFVLSAFADNTVASKLGVTIAKGANKPAMAMFFAIMALMGGLFSPIGDITSFLFWKAGTITTTGFIYLIPPAIVGALIVFAMLRRHLQLKHGEQVSVSKIDILKMVGGMGLFVLVPFMKLKFDVFPGITMGSILLVMTFSKMKLPHKHAETEARKIASFIALMLVLVSGSVDALKVAGEFVSQGPEWVLATASVFISAGTDNIPFTLALLGALNFVVNGFLVMLLATALGLGGALTSIGSSSSITTSEILGITFKQYLQYWYVGTASVIGACLTLYVMKWIGIPFGVQF